MITINNWQDALRSHPHFELMREYKRLIKSKKYIDRFLATDYLLSAKKVEHPDMGTKYFYIKKELLDNDLYKAIPIYEIPKTQTLNQNKDHK